MENAASDFTPYGLGAARLITGQGRSHGDRERETADDLKLWHLNFPITAWCRGGQITLYNNDTKKIIEVKN